MYNIHKLIKTAHAETWNGRHRPNPIKRGQAVREKVIPQRYPNALEGYFLWSLSDIMNATSIPKDIISVNELTTSIGEHLPPREVSQTKTNGGTTMLPNPSCEAGLL